MSITINMSKAKDIHRNKIRDTRKPLLEAKDVEFQRALEAGSDTAAIVAAKQALRDAPASAAINDATTVDELKAAWDTNLLGTSPYTN